jgi:hypothetical protein
LIRDNRFRAATRHFSLSDKIFWRAPCEQRVEFTTNPSLALA